MRTTITEAAALETLAVALFESRQRASDEPTPQPWHYISTEMRNTYRAYAHLMLADRDAFDNPPPVTRTLTHFEAEILCILDFQNPRGYVDVKDHKAGKEAYYAWIGTVDAGWTLSEGQYGRAVKIAHDNEWACPVPPKDYEFERETASA